MQQIFIELTLKEEQEEYIREVILLNGSLVILSSSRCPCKDTQARMLESLLRPLFDHRPGMEHVCVGLRRSYMEQKKLGLVLFHIMSSSGKNQSQLSFISNNDWQFWARANSFIRRLIPLSGISAITL